MQFTPDLRKKVSSSDVRIPPMAENFPKQRSDLSVRVVENETVVLDRRGAQIHQLNQTATYIWDWCDGKSTVWKIANGFAADFEVDPKTAAKDVAAIVWQLQRLNLLEPSSEFTILSES